jgi:hypothetical protein
LDGIFLAADAFTAGAEQHDDMTLLVMKVNTGTGSITHEGPLSARNSDFSHTL